MFWKIPLHTFAVLLFFVVTSPATLAVEGEDAVREPAAVAATEAAAAKPPAAAPKKTKPESDLLPKDQASLVLWAAAIVLTLIALSIVWSMFRGNLSSQVASFLFEGGTAEQGGKPSASRLQMVIWNFVVAFSFIYLLASHDALDFVNELFTNQVLWLLGISNGTYLLGKVASGGTTDSTATATPNADRGGQPVTGGEGPGPEGQQ